MRISWDQYFINLCKQVGDRSTCCRKKVGAIFVKDNRILTTGYNGSLPGFPHCENNGCNLIIETSKNKSGEEIKKTHCVSGDTIIPKFQEGGYNSKHKTIKELYEYSIGNNTKAGVKLTRIRCVNEEGIITPGRILGIYHVGKKEVYEIETFSKHRVKVTEDHKFRTEDGWKELKFLKVGNKVAINGEELYRSKDWLTKKYDDEQMTQLQISKLCGINRYVIKKMLLNFNIPIRPKIFGGWNRKLYKDKNSDKWTDSPFTVGINLTRWTATKCFIKEKCDICGIDKRLQIHHLDKDITNNIKENLLTLCVECHNLYHSKNPKRKKMVFDKITMIKKIGEEECYDITTSHGNFVGNNFILHNCNNTIHSERNAINQAAIFGISLANSTIYITCFPCYRCAMDIISVKTNRIVYLEDYTDEYSSEILEKSHITIEKLMV